MLLALEDPIIDFMMVYNLQETLLDLENKTLSDYEKDETLNFMLIDPKVNLNKKLRF